MLSNLTAQVRSLGADQRYKDGQYRGHRPHRAEQHGNSVRHGAAAPTSGAASAAGTPGRIGSTL